MAKRGLVVTYYFPPLGGGGVQRWVKFIKYLSRRDWQFDVVTAAGEKSVINDPTLLNDLPATTKIFRTMPDSHEVKFLRNITDRIPRGYRQRWLSAFLNITDSRQSWNREVIPVINAHLEKEDYDVMFISMPPYSTARLAAHYNQKLTIPVIFDMRDPWTINPYKIHPTALHRLLDQYFEKKTISRINYITSAYHSVVQAYQKYSNIRFCVIANGYDEEDFVNLEGVELAETKSFHLAFSGSFYSHLNSPEKLFQAIKLLKMQKIEITFHHIGVSVQNLQRMAERYDISDHIRLWGYQSHRRCLEILKSMDGFCVILDPASRNADKTVGGKVYEYLRLQKPILGIIPENGEAAALIRETDSGIICKHNQPQIIAECLNEMMNSKKQFGFVRIDRYSREIQAETLDEFVADILNQHVK